MESPEQIKGNLVGEKGGGGNDGGDPDRTPYEDEALAVDIGDATPEQEEAAKGEGVGRDDPLEPAFRDGQGLANGGQNDDNALVGESL